MKAGRNQLKCLYLSLVQEIYYHRCTASGVGWVCPFENTSLVYVLGFFQFVVNILVQVLGLISFSCVRLGSIITKMLVRYVNWGEVEELHVSWCRICIWVGLKIIPLATFSTYNSCKNFFQ